MGEKEIEKASNLGIIARYGIGVDNVDLEAAKRKGIYVTNTPGAASQSIAEYTIAAIYELSKGLRHFDRKSSKEAKSMMMGDVTGKTLGIIGLGSIGKELAARAKNIGLEVIAYNRTKYTSLAESLGIKLGSVEDVLRNSDFVSVNIALTDDTKGIIDYENMDLMRRSACLIDTSRAGVVSQKALYNALKNKDIAGAVLDVYSSDYDFASLENVILTPHVSSRTTNTTRNKVNMVTYAVVKYLTNQEVPYSVVEGNRQIK